jgi:hypothetical protein
LLSQPFESVKPSVSTTPSRGEVDALWQRFAQAGDDNARLAAWIGLQCAAVPGARQGVIVLGAADTGPFVPRATWPGGSETAKVLAETAERSLASRQALIVPVDAAAMPGPPSCTIAFPVEFDGRLHGVVALHMAAGPAEQLQWSLRQLQWGIGWIEALARRGDQHDEQATQERLMTVLDLVATVLEQERFDEAARALVTEIAMRQNCDRVSIGLVKKGHARVIAVSHSAQFGKRMNLINSIGIAMDEAIDQKTVVTHPLAADAEVVVTRDHENLAREHGSDCILTVPFAGGADFVGALMLERPAHMPFDAPSVELMQSVMAVLGRMLEAKRANDLPWYRRAGDALAEKLGYLLGTRHMKTKFVLLCVALAGVFLTLATGLWRVSATASLEGAVRRTLVAPFDGYVLSAPRRAGDVVRAQTVLASLDDRDLRLERIRWGSQYAQYAKQYEEAVAVRDRAKAQVAQAQTEQARAQAALIDEQLARATVRAPYDGLVVKGDLSQALGSSVKRGETLFEIAPLNAYRVIVQVDESEIAGVRVGQRGTLVLSSITEENFTFTVSKVTPVTTAREGRNYFRVEGILDNTSERLRPGMEGIGKIEIEERRWIWIWTYRLMNWFRLFIWSWWP